MVALKNTSRASFIRSAEPLCTDETLLEYPHPALMVCDYCCCGCTGLRGKLPKAINLPASITVPFGSFEEVLSQAANKNIKKQLDAAIKDIPVEKAEEALSKCRELVMQVCLQPRLPAPPA